MAGAVASVVPRNVRSVVLWIRVLFWVATITEATPSPRVAGTRTIQSTPLSQRLAVSNQFGRGCVDERLVHSVVFPFPVAAHDEDVMPHR